MLSKSAIIENIVEAVNQNNVDALRHYTDDLISRVEHPTMMGVVELKQHELEDLDIPTLLRMLISVSEVVGEESLGREAIGIAHDNQAVLLQTIKGRYHDLETKLQQINEISRDGCDTSYEDGWVDESSDRRGSDTYTGDQGTD